MGSSIDYKDSQNIIARLNLPNMHYHKQDKIELYAAAQQGLHLFESDLDKQLKYLDFIDYYADLSEQELIDYKTSQLDQEGVSMRLIDVLKQEYLKEGMLLGMEQGLEKGHENGLQQGLIEGEKKSLRRLLLHRFQKVPDWAVDRILQASDAQIEHWLDNVLYANDIEAVFTEPPSSH